jgi:FkbM family methyltransferase
MSIKPLKRGDHLKVLIARIFNTLHWRTQSLDPLSRVLRIIGDKIIRGTKVTADDIVYVLIDLSSLYIIQHDYERKVRRFILNNMPPDGVFIDVGAHIGKYSLLVAKKYPNAEVIAIEPNPLAYDALSKALKINNLINVQVFNVALSDSDNLTDLYIRRSSVASSIEEFDSCIEIRRVTTRALDSLIDELGFKRVDLIKIDVEGAELKVVKGSLNTILQFKPKLMIECEDRHYDELMRILRGVGYQCSVLERYDYERYSNIACTYGGLNGSQQIKEQ